MRGPLGIIEPILGIIMALVVLWALLTVAQADECFADCTGTGWTLYLEDNQLSWPEGSMTEEECEALWHEIEPQTPPFSRLVCVETEVKQEKI